MSTGTTVPVEKSKICFADKTKLENQLFSSRTIFCALLQGDDKQIFRLIDLVDVFTASFPLLGDSVPLLFQNQTELQMLAACDPVDTCETTQLIKFCSPMSFYCIITHEGLKMALSVLGETLSQIEPAVQTLREGLTLHFNFMHDSEQSQRRDDCLHIIVEALNATDNVLRVFDLLEEIAISQDVAKSVQASQELVHIFHQQNALSINADNWKGLWNQKCSWAIQFVKEVKYDLLLGRENYKSCKDIFHKAKTFGLWIDKLLTDLMRDVDVANVAAENAEKYLKNNATKWSLTNTFLSEDFKNYVQLIRSSYPKILGFDNDFQGEADAGRICLTQAFEQLMIKPILALGWERMMELGLMAELQKQNTSITLTRETMADNLNYLVENYFLWFSDIIDILRRLVDKMEIVVQDVDRVDSLLKLFTAQTQTDASYFM